MILRTAAGDLGQRRPGLALLGLFALVLASVAGLTAGSAQGAAPYSCTMTITDPTGAVVTSAKNGVRLTYTLTVTSNNGKPLAPGTVSFWVTSQDQLGDNTQLTSFNGNSGSGSITDASLAASATPYSIVGRYYTASNSNFGTPACQTAPSSLTIASSGPTQTVTTVTITPSSISRGDYVTLTAHVTQDGNPNGPVGGNVVFSSGQIAHFGGGNGTVPLIDNVATLTVPIQLPAGTYIVVANYFGNITDNLANSAGTATLQVVDNSALTYFGTPTVQVGGTATLGGTLKTPDGTALAGRYLTLAIVGTTASCTTDKTDQTGYASCTTTVDAPAGTYTTVANFAGDDLYKPVQGAGSITVTKAPATIAYTGDTRASVGRTGTLSALLTNAATHAPIANATVSLSVVGHPELGCTTTTDSHGIAACSSGQPVALPTGSFEIDADFGGNSRYSPASDHTASIQIVTSVPTTLTFNPLPAQPAGSTVAPSFTLTDANGRPVVGVPVTVSFNGSPSTATTDGNGIATFAPAQLLRLGGTFSVSATFGGAPGYDPTAPAAGSVTVLPAPTSLTIQPTAPVLAGQPARLSARLMDTVDGGGIGGQTVTLSFDGVVCTGQTDATGSATCTTTAITGPARSVSTTASVAASPAIAGANATGTAIVYAFASGGGSFVLGDRTPLASTVTFWDAQWWKVNVLSGGSPSSFKGFAESAPSTCGGTWTTRTGNSTPPPDGPLPAYMAVIVSSTVTQSGSVISGDVQRIVVVATNAGYDGNPGHSGTGTVIATICG